MKIDPYYDIKTELEIKIQQLNESMKDESLSTFHLIMKQQQDFLQTLLIHYNYERDNNN